MTLKDSNTEEKILEAAKTAFMTHGLYGARMQDIANNAGINKALLHYYFRSKEKLFDHVFEGALSKYFQQMLVFSDTSLPVEQRIHKYIDNIIDFLSEYPQMAMFIIKEISMNPEVFHEKVKTLKPSNGRSLLVLLKESMVTGEVPPHIDPVIFITNLHSLCSYPFLASPIFKSMCRAAELDWEDPNNEKLKNSVKEFVSFKLRKSEQ
jgi:TetR/AcrR family transcriptional regulator